LTATPERLSNFLVMSRNKPHANHSFDSFLQAEGVFDEAIAKTQAIAKAEYFTNRLPDALKEYFFLIDPIKFPAPNPMPPPWVMAAIARVGDVAALFKEGKMLNKPGSEWTPSDVGVMKGVTKSASTLFTQGSPSLVRDEEKHPALKEYRSQVFLKTNDAIAGQIKASMPKENDSLPKIEGTKQLLEFEKGKTKGMSLVLDQDGEQNVPPLTAQICMQLWFLWPTLPVSADDFTIPKLRAWFSKALFLDVDQKLLEKVCNDIGLRRVKKGRPKKKT
jgi:hypothetical protein